MKYDDTMIFEEFYHMIKKNKKLRRRANNKKDKINRLKEPKSKLKESKYAFKGPVINEEKGEEEIEDEEEKNNDKNGDNQSNEGDDEEDSQENSQEESEEQSEEQSEEPSEEPSEEAKEETKEEYDEIAERIKCICSIKNGTFHYENRTFSPNKRVERFNKTFLFPNIKVMKCLLKIKFNIGQIFAFLLLLIFFIISIPNYLWRYKEVDADVKIDENREEINDNQNEDDINKENKRKIFAWEFPFEDLKKILKEYEEEPNKEKRIFCRKSIKKK